MYADLSGAVTAVNENNGRIRWSRALGTDVYGARLIGRTLVVDIDQVGSQAQVIGLNPISGALDWRYRPGGDGLYGDPVPAGDVGLAIVKSPPRTGFGRRRQRETALAPLDRLAGRAGDRRDDRGSGRGQQHHARVRGRDGRPALDSGRHRQHGFAHPRRRRRRRRLPGDPRPDSDRRLRARHWTTRLGTWSGRRIVAAHGDDGRLGRRSGLPSGPRWSRPRRARHRTHRLAVQHRSPRLPGHRARRRRVQSRDGRAAAPERSVVRAPAPTDHRVVRRPRIQSGPLTLAALGPDLYGTGLGPNGKTESGFIERIGSDGVIWRVTLPQPAQTSPVALPEGGIAVQTEDLGCATPLARRTTNLGKEARRLSVESRALPM